MYSSFQGLAQVQHFWIPRKDFGQHNQDISDVCIFTCFKAVHRSLEHKLNLIKLAFLTKASKTLNFSASLLTLVNL